MAVNVPIFIDGNPNEEAAFPLLAATGVMIVLIGLIWLIVSCYFKRCLAANPRRHL